MSTKIDRDNFDPMSVKVVGKKKINTVFFDKEIPNRKQTNDDSNLPHQHLLDKLEAFSEEFAMGLGLTDGWDFAREELRKDDDGLKKALQGYQDTVSNCTVTGVWLFGDRKPSIQFEGTVITKAGSQKNKTPRISLDPSVTPYAENLLTKIEELKTELWAYLFDGKFTKKKVKKEAAQEDPNQTKITDEDQQNANEEPGKVFEMKGTNDKKNGNKAKAAKA